MWFTADTHAATASITVDLVHRPTGGQGNTLASISLSSASDGGGQTNHSYKYIEIDPPVVIPAGIVGFQTRAENGNISDARVGADTREQIGEYVSDVFIT